MLQLHSSSATTPLRQDTSTGHNLPFIIPARHPSKVNLEERVGKEKKTDDATTGQHFPLTSSIQDWLLPRRQSHCRV